MRSEVKARLLEMNREFYQSFAAAFVDKRKRLQPGVLRAIQDLSEEAQVLDLGCGHGALASHLHRQGFRGRYLGLDASQEMLNRVPSDLQAPTFRFLRLDLTSPGWHSAFDAIPSHYEWSCAFAILHHLPSKNLRMQAVSGVRALLAPRGRMALSVWDFLASPRLAQRIVAWEQVGLEPEDVDEGDYLIDWRHGGHGLRYVHHFSSEELRSLAQIGEFRVVSEFRADGGLGLYQIWESLR